MLSLVRLTFLDICSKKINKFSYTYNKITFSTDKLSSDHMGLFYVKKRKKNKRTISLKVPRLI